ncbi:protease [Gossypium australe]|uniref:Protease n=1 Tax=Gossypium australe TaxID=47621 RepID=A0A5B6W885_9ROSI|nr:protease [Gossypium australe]
MKLVRVLHLLEAMAGVVETKSERLGRVYVARELQDCDSTDVIADSSSTYSYILSDLTSEMGISVEAISLGMTILSSWGKSVVVDRVKVFPVDLTELHFHDFDVILRMDWLTE